MRQKHEYYVEYDNPSNTLADGLANWAYERACRIEFERPGFVLINLPGIQSSH